MEFNEFLKNELEHDPELKREYDALQPEYEIIEKLIRARIDSNMTQKELAKKCGIKQSNISRLESGKANPTLRFLKKLADSLDCDLVIEFRKRELVKEKNIEASKSKVMNIEFENTVEKIITVGLPQK